MHILAYSWYTCKMQNCIKNYDVQTKCGKVSLLKTVSAHRFKFFSTVLEQSKAHNDLMSVDADRLS